MGAGIAYQGAANNRFLQDFQDELRDANDDWWQDGPTLAARSWQLYQNDPYFHALIETLISAVIGANGLTYRSLYQEEDGRNTTQAELDTRSALNGCVRRATARNRFDASGMMSYREMDAATERSALITGDGIAIRLWKPGRPDATHATCWRLIDSARVSNPQQGPNTDRLFEGFELDGDGRPVAIHVQKTHPHLTRTAPVWEWQRIPIHAPDGSRLVTHRKRLRRPEQIRGIGVAAPVLLYLAMLKGTAEAWAIAKRIQASYALLIKTADPAKAARDDRFGATIPGRTPTQPGQRLYHNHDSVEPLNWNFQGSDFENFRNPIIEAVCAAENVPYEIVLQRLTKSNLASSRAALLSFYTTGRKEQNGHIEDVSVHWTESVIREDVARGRVSVASSDWDEVLRARWLRPPRVWPDPQKEAQAARAWADLGRSLTSVYDEAGLDFEAEILQRREDNAFLKSQGISISEETISERIVTEPVSPVTADDKAKASDEDAGGEGDAEDADDDAPAPPAVAENSPK